MPSPLERLEEARGEVLAASGTDFLRRLGEYALLLKSEKVVRDAVNKLRQEVVDADERLTGEDVGFVTRLIPIRRQLTEEEPEVDDSGEPWPGPYNGLDPARARAFHDWTYTLANFDAIAEDRAEKVKVEGGGDQLNQSRTQMLIAILNGKLHDLVFPFNERPAPRSDLMGLYDQMSEVGHEQTNAYRRAERIADENGYFGLVWIEHVAEAMESQDSRPLKTPDEKRLLLEEALSKPDLFRLYELLRPAEGRGPLSEKDIERITRLEEKSRAELDRLHRPLRSRIKRREAEVAPPKKNRRLPTLVGRISRVPPALAFIADLGGITLLILAGLKWIGAI